MAKPSLSVERIHAALAILGITACGGSPPPTATPEKTASEAASVAPTTPAAPAPTTAPPTGVSGPGGASQPTTGETKKDTEGVDAGAPFRTPKEDKKPNRRPGGAASCSAGTSGPDGKGH